MAERLALLGQDVGQTAQGLGGVDDAGGVVRGVDEDAGDVLVQHRFKGVEIRLERRGLRGHDLEDSAGAPTHRAVLRGSRGAKVSTSSPGLVTARMAWAIAPAAPVVGKISFCS